MLLPLKGLDGLLASREPNISREKLAADCNIASSTLRLWEHNGTTSRRVEEAVRRIADYLDCSPLDVFGVQEKEE